MFTGTDVLALILFSLATECRTARPPAGSVRGFDPQRDLLSLHYDHAPDKDDGHSAAADRTLLQTLYGAEWLRAHALAVSGAYGENSGLFDRDSDAVMDAVWNEWGGWLAAHDAPEAVRDDLASRWLATLEGGGDVWVKEGGRSNITSDVVARIRSGRPAIDTRSRIHVVQHSGWNEDKTTDSALAYTRANTAYLWIRAALAHPVYGDAWRAAFEYYPPDFRLDFSDTDELLHIVGLGVIGFDEFRERFLANPP